MSEVELNIALKEYLGGDKPEYEDAAYIKPSFEAGWNAAFSRFRQQLEAAQAENERLKGSWNVSQLNRKDEIIAKQEAENDRLKAIIKKAQEQGHVGEWHQSTRNGDSWIKFVDGYEPVRGMKLYSLPPIPAEHSEDKASSIELDEKQEMKYQSLLESQDWINTDFRKLAIRIAVKLNYSGNGLIDYYPAVLFAEAILPHSSVATKELISGLEKMIKTVKPLSNFEEYQVLSMSPTQMINHINRLISQSEGKPSEPEKHYACYCGKVMAAKRNHCCSDPDCIPH